VGAVGAVGALSDGSVCVSAVCDGRRLLVYVYACLLFSLLSLMVESWCVCLGVPWFLSSWSVLVCGESLFRVVCVCVQMVMVARWESMRCVCVSG